MNDRQDFQEQITSAQTSSDTFESVGQYDVAILGGGIAGLSLALELKKVRPTTSILVVERQEHPVPEAAHKVGESTVEIAAYYMRNVLDLREHLQTQQLSKFGLRLFFSFDGNQDIARRVELGHSIPPPRPVATYQVDRGRLENALGCELPRRGISFLHGYKVQQISLQPQDDFHCLRIHRQGDDREIQTRWIVDAGGRSTLLQRQLGLAKKVGHVANAVWFRLNYPIDVNQWSSDPAWQGRICEGERRLSTNHLMGPGYWVWLIPLASNSTSVGIVTDAHMHSFDEMNLFERALNWLHRHEPQCARVIEQHQADLQDFRVMKDYSYSCEQVFSDERWCLIGEAAVSLDPLYSPGGDLIAIGNGLACDLLTHALDGEDIEERAAIHNQVFLLLTNSWRGIYEKQYTIMGNAQIMAAKVIWDTAVYWAAPGLLYFHDKFRNLTDSSEILQNLAMISTLSDRIQAFFREWHAIGQVEASDTFITYYDFDFMERLHIGMTEELSDAALETQFAANVLFLQQLAGQLVSTVIETFADDQDNEVIQCQLQHWRGDEFLSNLVMLYQQTGQEHLTNRNWITLGRQKQEVAG
jgi:flavin-dependent dehydrogenase